MDHRDEIEAYTAPTVRSLGSVEEMTRQQFDKIGSAADAYTPAIPTLDGTVFPDP